MTDLFPRAGRLKIGYRRDQVDEFFTQAREAYEQADGGAMDAIDVRRASFDLKRGGYATPPVDAALDRLEQAFAARSRESFIKQKGQEAWLADLANRAQVLYPRLRRPAGERFARPGGISGGYDAKAVDEVLDRLTGFFDRGEAISAEELRSLTFKRRAKWRAYEERVVDAYLARAVDILLGVA
ncbi:DivIVA domain-containing protein [Demequina zhanjiangensis]|uniref:DivIVA domain-containing protein n=1 Tax=Demequina zhanjiangensis TaxID=3051659 RepID=A0ABT8G3E1_9MICO|nr:DivIVA domain-containing protein [Demequina sp. SYSU T00b26]MDN4473592.1 DivIVA domain-containing protein [Demequina sp. SYSU T00b26]